MTRLAQTAGFAAALAAGCLAAFASSAAAESWCDAPPAPELATLTAVDVGNDWFAVYSVAPSVYAITEPRQYEGVNSFLVVGTKRAVLFDSGLGVARIGAVVAKLTALPVTVLNSHTHFDHVGGNHEFTDVRNLDVPFSAASARGDVGEALRDYAKDTLAEDRVCGALPAGVTSRAYATPTWKASAPVQDGERFDLGDRTLEVLKTPGHTPDSMCLLDAANGLLFTGDTFYSGEVFLWAPETDVAGYEASIARLAKLAPGLKLLLPAHGVPVAEPAQLLALDRALKDIEAGAVTFETTKSGRRLYKFGHFSILKAAPAGSGAP
jgi:glyoxylase-like metal-dependent hydrolase (beta-lactamase superfamily II)